MQQERDHTHDTVSDTDSDTDSLLQDTVPFWYIIYFSAI